jgi:hypothetical protein
MARVDAEKWDTAAHWFGYLVFSIVATDVTRYVVRGWPGAFVASHVLNHDRMEVLFNGLDYSGCARRWNPGARSTVRVGV